MDARAKAIEVMAYAFYVQDTGMPDCWRTESDGARGWYREMAEAALAALLTAYARDETGEHARCSDCSDGVVPGTEPLVLALAGLTALPMVEARSVFSDEKIEGVEFYVRRAGSPDA